MPSDHPAPTAWRPLTALRYVLANWLLLLVYWVTPHRDQVLDDMAALTKRNAALARGHLHAE